MSGAVVLMYHRLGSGRCEGREPGEEFYVVGERTFKRQLGIMAESRCNVTALEQLAGWGVRGKVLPRRAVAITFDDGNASDYQHAVPALRKRGLTATFFVCPAFVGQAGYVSWPELREMAASGMAIGAHGLDHTMLDTLARGVLRQHLMEARRVMEARLGQAPVLLSLPGGRGGSEAVNVAVEVGFRIVVDSVPARLGPRQRGALPRYAVRSGDSFESFRALVEQRPMMLLRHGARYRATQYIRRGFGEPTYQAVRDAWSKLTGGAVSKRTEEQT